MHEAWVWVWYELLDWMINGCTEKHFDLDSVKYKSTISTNNPSFQESNITKLIENSYYVVGKKSQKLFHTTCVINFIVKNLIFMNRVTIIVQ